MIRETMKPISMTPCPLKARRAYDRRIVHVRLALARRVRGAAEAKI